MEKKPRRKQNYKKIERNPNRNKYHTSILNGSQEFQIIQQITTLAIQIDLQFKAIS